METSAMIHVPWVGLAMAALTALSVAGLAGVTLEHIRAIGRASQAPVAPTARPTHGAPERITPDWIERLITGAGVPRGPRPPDREHEGPERDVA